MSDTYVEIYPNGEYKIHYSKKDKPLEQPIPIPTIDDACRTKIPNPPIANDSTDMDLVAAAASSVEYANIHIASRQEFSDEQKRGPGRKNIVFSEADNFLIKPTVR